jgi:menaquinone-dependent protoporphyrinogen oxidase
MTVLVAVASKHGSTRGIADAIAGELRALGLAADVGSVDDVADPDRYEAVVLGSAVYMGKWMPEARRFVDTHRDALGRVPVWLFSSGPLGADEPKPAGDPAQLDDLMTATRAHGHRIFSGKLEPGELGLGERLIVKAVHAPAGDFRDWDAIRAWAREIGTTLQASAAPRTHLARGLRITAGPRSADPTRVWVRAARRGVQR